MTDTTTATDPTQADDTTTGASSAALPDYQGRVPVGMTSRITGLNDLINAPHGVGQRAVVVVLVECTDAGHRKTSKGLKYHETYEARELLTPDPDAGRRLWAVLSADRRAAADKAAARAPLPGMAVVTDASGVVLTEAELADLRGDPVAAIRGPGALIPAVVVYDDGSRLMWPDDFPPDTPRPELGDPAEDDEDSAEVEDLLDVFTGESLTTGDNGEEE